MKIDMVENLLHPFQDKHVVQIVSVDTGEKIQHGLAKSFPDMNFIFVRKDIIRIEANKPILAGAVVRFLEEQGVEVSEARRIRPSLEDVFVKITGIESGIMKQEKEKSGMGGKA